MVTVTLMYALLQLPAYYAFFVMPIVTPDPFGKAIFFALFLLKIPFAFLFISYFVSAQRPNFDDAKFLPTHDVRPDRWVWAPIITVILAGGTVGLGAVSAVVSKGFEKWIAQQFAPADEQPNAPPLTSTD
jgi:hypothetical protein